MTALKAKLLIAEDGGEVRPAMFSVDVIEFDGGLWLVPRWLDTPDKKETMPERIVSLATIPYQRARGSRRIVVSAPVPRAVLEGRCPPELAAQYVVVEHPNIRLPHPNVQN